MTDFVTAQEIPNEIKAETLGVWSMPREPHACKESTPQPSCPQAPAALFLIPNDQKGQATQVTSTWAGKYDND